MPLTERGRSASVERMLRCLRPLHCLVVLVVVASLALSPTLATAQTEPAPPGEPELLASDDPDIQIADTYFVLQVVSSASLTGFGAGAIAGGVESFILAGQSAGPSGSQHVFMGLTLVSLGSASLINGVMGIDSSQRRWKARRRAFLLAGPAERRVIREREIARLRSRARSHALGIVADGSFLGLGIALSLLSPSGVSVPLLVNGAFILGLDIFQLVVDDQTAKSWERRNTDAAAGFFGQGKLRRGPRILAVGASPWAGQRPGGERETGFVFSLSGVY